MKKITVITATIFIASLNNSPAFADDMALDSAAMVEQVSPVLVNPITPSINSFNLDTISRGKNEFMATMTTDYQAGYRIAQNAPVSGTKQTSGLVALLVPEEYSFRSSAQDSGVDAVTPGRFLSGSIRSDYLSDTGPAAYDKSSLGVRLGF